MNPALLNDVDSRMRKDWSKFVSVWQQTQEHWNDSRRQQFEREDLQSLPSVMSHTAAALAEFRDFAAMISEQLRDEETEHEYFV